MAESLTQVTQEVWDAAYWEGIDAQSSDVNAKIAERLDAADNARVPSGYASNSYNFHSSDLRGGEVDEVGRLRAVSRRSTREASLGVDGMPEAGDIVSVRALGGVSLTPEFSDVDIEAELPPHYD